MAYDVTKLPFSDIRVRIALQMAVDIETINDTYYKGLAVVTPQGNLGNFQTAFAIHYDDWPEEIKAGYRYDPDAAERLLDEAGYPRGENGTRFMTPMDGTSYAAFNADYFDIVRDYWSKIGVETEMALHEVTAWAARVQKREFEGMTWAIAAAPYHPLNTLNTFTSGFAWNRGQVSDPKYDALYESMRAAQTVEELGEFAKQADLYAVAQHWQLFGPVEPSYNVTQSWVKGHIGEFYMGVWNKNAVYARVWIDQDLKEEMGF
jgi:peptide/nickel transport system substrate-binding protein